jgi:hypothetical protein
MTFFFFVTCHDLQPVTECTRDAAHADMVLIIAKI